MEAPDGNNRLPTPALALLGALSSTERGARALARAGWRVTAAAVGPARAAWGSPQLAPARRLGDEALQALVEQGRTQQAEISGRLVDAIAAAVAGAVDLVFTTPEMEAALDRAIERALDSPTTERLVAELLANPGVERIAVQVLDSRLLDELIDRLLVSPELQKIVSHIAESDEVRAALTQQSFGLADELAGQVRTQTSRADDSVERIARRLLRRRARQLSELGEDQRGA
jgi:hypothetical protein